MVQIRTTLIQPGSDWDHIGSALDQWSHLVQNGQDSGIKAGLNRDHLLHFTRHLVKHHTLVLTLPSTNTEDLTLGLYSAIRLYNTA